MKVRVLFTLSMPNVGSWNGRWSGEGKRYVIERSLAADVAERVLSKSESAS